MAAVSVNLDRAVQDAFERQDAIGNGLQLVGPAVHDDDFEAVVVIEVNVQGRADFFAQIMLQLGQALAQVADVVIVNEGQRTDRVDPAADLALVDGGAGQVA